MNLDLLMRRVMVQLSLVSDGATMRLDRTGGRSSDTDTVPKTSSAIPWLTEAWYRAQTPARKAHLIRIALEQLKLARVRIKAKHDLQTRDGRLAVGREAAETTVAKVAQHYGYSRQHVYDLREQWLREERARNGQRQRQRYDGTLEMRCAIAASPGTSREVADEFGVSASSVASWRRAIRPKGEK